MAEVRHTDDATRDAITGELTKNVFVEAGAGTGKTTSLIARLMALVESGVPVEQIVAITFTRAAAAELRVRIRQELEQRRSDGEKSEWLEQALANVDSAAFRTIDSHVQSLLREYPIEAGLPPGMEIQGPTYEIESFSEHWSEWVGFQLEEDSEFVRMLGRAMTMGMANPLGVLRELANEVNEHHGFVEFAETTKTDYGDAVDGAVRLSLQIERLDELAQTTSNRGDRLYEYIKERVDWWRANIGEGIDTEDHALDLLANVPVITAQPRRGVKSNWPSGVNVVREQVGEVADLYASELGGLRSAVASQMFNYALSFVRDELVASRISEGKLTFHDGMVFAVRLLRDIPSVRQSVQRKHTHVLVDEFQDTDPLQVELVELMTISVGEPDFRPGALFCVGDPKQSIYRFRGADVEVSSSVMERVDDSDDGLALSLVENHRSSVEVIEWVNAVCGKWMRPDRGVGQAMWTNLEPDMRARESDHHGAVYMIGNSWVDASVRDIEAWESDDVRLVALAAAHGKFQVTERDGKVRASRAGDLAIISPRRRRWSTYTKELESAGIDYVAEGDDVFFASQMVRDIINCLLAIDDPTNQVATLGALRSYWFACSDLDFRKWFERGGKFGLLTDDELPRFGGPVEEGLEVLRRYHAMRDGLMPSVLLERLVRERQVRERCLVIEDLQADLATLEGAIELVRGFESEGTGSLRESVRKLEAMRAGGQSMRLEPTRLSGDDKVHLMTIHQSKGLEFPIVLVVDTDVAPRRESNTLLLAPGARSGNSEDGTDKFAVRMKNGNDRFDVGNYEVVVESGKSADILETARRYYVAATRAKDVLIVSQHRKSREGMSTPADYISAFASDVPHLWHPLPPEWSHLPRVIDPEPSDVRSNLDEIDVDEWKLDYEETVARASADDIVSPSSLHGEFVRGRRPIAKVARPEPLDEDALAARGRAATDLGRAVHAGLQELIGYGKWSDGNALGQVVREQCVAHGVSAHSDEVEALIKATMRVPTIETVCSLPSSKRWVEVSVAGGAKDGSGTVYDGQIDLLYETELGGLVVVDFKTDREFGRTVAEMAQPYEMQLRAYADAVESATGCEVVEGKLVFSRLAIDDPVGAEHSFSLGGFARSFKP